jgi:hypothetical protein
MTGREFNKVRTDREECVAGRNERKEGRTGRIERKERNGKNGTDERDGKQGKWNGTEWKSRKAVIERTAKTEARENDAVEKGGRKDVRTAVVTEVEDGKDTKTGKGGGSCDGSRGRGGREGVPGGVMVS